MAPIQIVVADDEPEICALVADILEEEGYAVHKVGDGLSALVAIRHVAPALAILDVAMPAMTGDETLRQLREEGSPVPIIMMTAGTNPQRLLRVGATSVLAKPFEVHSLLSSVAQALRPHR